MEGSRKSGETFGEYLTRERTLRNIRLEEIAYKTRISLKTLQAIESNASDELPAGVYVRGFLRSYARHVGLDESEVVLRYEDYLQQDGIAQRAPVALWKEKRRLPVVWLLLFLIGLSGLAGYWFWWRPSHPPTPVSAPQPPPAAADPGTSSPPMPEVRPIPMPPPPSPSPPTPR